MARGVARYLVGSVVVLGLAACGKMMFAERDAWRHEAEVACLKTGQVKESASLTRIQPISGPGVCGADFPLKVAALGEGSVMGYSDPVVRPPGSVPVAQPSYPQQSYPPPYPQSSPSAPVTLAPSPPRASEPYPRGYDSRTVNDPMSESGGGYT